MKEPITFYRPTSLERFETSLDAMNRLNEFETFEVFVSYVDPMTDLFWQGMVEVKTDTYHKSINNGWVFTAPLPTAPEAVLNIPASMDIYRRGNKYNSVNSSSFLEGGLYTAPKTFNVEIGHIRIK